MMEYHLSINGERSGPFSQFTIIQRIRDGQLKKTDLIWQPGMEGWIPTGELDEFSDYWPITEEEKLRAEKARDLARTALDQPQPWLRFWARMLDYLWFIGVIAMLVQAFMPESVVKWITQTPRTHVPLDTLIVSLVILLFAPLEALLLSYYGTTPGRGLLRLQVRQKDGRLPEFRQALYRSFHVFIVGIALWLPLVSLLAMTWWRIQLSKTGTTPWDVRWETRVEHGEPEVWRYLTLGFILFLIAVMVLMNLMMNPESIQSVKQS